MIKKFLIIVGLTLVLLSPSETSSAAKDIVRGRDYYIVKYLKIFSNLEPADVLTVVTTESNSEVDLITPEPNVKDHSYGPMQVRGHTARLMGFRGDLEELCTWEYGLYYGMKYLSWKKEEAFKKAKNPITRRKHTWAGYNAGRPLLVKRNGEWQYVNQTYVNTCETHYKRLEKHNQDEKYNQDSGELVYMGVEATNLGRD